MNLNAVFSAAPGSVILLCCEEARREEMIRTIRSSLPEDLTKRTALNSAPVVMMALCPDMADSSFGDLALLCRRLIISAGRRSHFEGLVLLNIAGLVCPETDRPRLRALGEVLSMEQGLFSRCVTVLYGPATEKQLLCAADCLDFEGRLKTAVYEPDMRPETLRSLLEQANLGCATRCAAEILKGVLDEMRSDTGFDRQRFLKSCTAMEGVITEESARAALSDPYSYVNRYKKIKALIEGHERSEHRRIGF